MSQLPLIAIVEDDAHMREALAELIEVLEFDGRTFDGAESFMATHRPGMYGCLITDLNLLGHSGLELQQRLRLVDPALPVIIISADTNPVTRSTAMHSGAWAYLCKPIDDQVLHKHLIAALHRRSPPMSSGRKSCGSH